MCNSVDFFSDFQNMNVDQVNARFCQNLRHVGQGSDLVGKIDEQVVKAGNCAKLFRAKRIASDFGCFEEIDALG